jgi:hypothetical protein
LVKVVGFAGVLAFDGSSKVQVHRLEIAAHIDVRRPCMAATLRFPTMISWRARGPAKVTEIRVAALDRGAFRVE